jgi:hypothetical protein
MSIAPSERDKLKNEPLEQRWPALLQIPRKAGLRLVPWTKSGEGTPGTPHG